MSLKVRLFRSDRSCLLLVLPLALVLFSAGLASRDLWAPDEPRTAEIVREILQSGSWAALHDNGGLYLEKPPLSFWLAALCARGAGRVTELSVRLPSSLAAVLAVICLFYLGRAMFGRRAGALAAIVLATSKDFFMEARWAHPDMLFTLFLLSACAAFYGAYVRARRTAWLAAFYLSIGFAMMTKGPAGLLLPLLSIVVFLAAERDLGFLRRAGIGWGLPVALLPTAAWLVAFRVSIGEAFPLAPAAGRIVDRFERGIHHPHPFPYILSELAIDFIPWTLVLPGALWHTFPRRRVPRDRENAYLYSWIVVLFSVFALSAEKRGVYLLPLMPLLALLCGRLWDTALLDWDPSPVDRSIGWSLVVALLLALLAPAVILPKIGGDTPALQEPAIVLAAVALLTAMASLAAHRIFGGGASLSVFGAGLIVCYLAIAGVVLPALDPYKSARLFSERIAGAAGPSPLGIYPDPHDAYAFYTGRTIAVLPDRDALRSFFHSAPRAFCLMEAEQYETERRALGLPLKVLDRDRVGHRAMVLVTPAVPVGGEGPGTTGPGRS